MLRTRPVTSSDPTPCELSTRSWHLFRSFSRARIGVLMFGVAMSVAVTMTSLAQAQTTDAATSSTSDASGSPGALETPVAGSEATASAAFEAELVTRAQQISVPHNLRGVADPDALRRWQAILDTAEKALARVRGNGGAIPTFREELLRIATDASAKVLALAPRLDTLRTEQQQLGPPPEDGAPEEPEILRAERSRLAEGIALLNGLIRASDAIEDRALNILADAEALRRARFNDRLMTRTQSPLLPGLWRDFAIGLQSTVGPIATLANAWWNRAAPYTPLLVLLGVVSALFAGLRALCRNVGPFRYREVQSAPPPFFHKIGANLVVAGLRAVPWLAALTTFYLGLAHLDLIPVTLSDLFEVTYRSSLLVVLVWALTKSLLAPANPQWRVAPLGDASAPRLLQLVTAIAAVHGLDHVVQALADAVQAPLAVTVGQSALFSFAFAVLAIAILRTPWRDADAQAHELAVEGASPLPQAATVDPATRLWPWWLKLPLWLVVGAILVAAVVGYLALARFLASQLVVTGLLVIVAWLAHLAVREITIELQSEKSLPAAIMTELFGASGVQRSLLAIVLGISLDLLILSALIPAILLQFGFSFDTIVSWLHAAFFGFDVGGVRLSLSQILIAAGLFAALIALVRLFQGWLDERVLAPPRVEEGLANSIKTGIGYAGVGIASLIAVSYAGFDFTNLAIVAGALSVGIGFGLQNIVNNFISGIILLIERPIQVGDWVVTGDAEGYVRRISVRSTEIETFDRSSVIVPNSELISGRVTNWTHRNKLGRVIVRVGVAYASDPDLIERLLLDVARRHDKVLAWPQPFVVFEDFGASSLDFSLRVYIADVNNMLSVRTALRRDIFITFREAGVEIPFPQQDLHLRDLDAVKDAFQRARERAARDAKAAEGPGDESAPPTATPES